MAKQHVQRRGGRAGVWWFSAVAVVVVAGAGIGAYAVERGPSTSTSGAGRPAHPAVAGRAAPSPTTTVAAAAVQAQLAGALTFSPAAGTAAVALDAPVQVKSSMGQITSVQVTSSEGSLTGVLSPVGDQWTSTSPLVGGQHYTVTARVSAAGQTATSVASFSTLTPAATVTDTLLPNGGSTVGVGQPVVIHFSRRISDATARAAVYSHFTITETIPVPGGWYWFSPTELHFRPEAFWPSGDHVTVASNLAGWDAGGGAWGTGTDSVQFTIGDSHVAVANLLTEKMTVSDNGHVIYTYPISAGRTSYPTQDGIHIVLDKEGVVHMVSSTVGIPVHSAAGYDEFVYNDVHISDSGEYVHSAPWSVGVQGRLNVSHGCINMSPHNSLTFYNFSVAGDIVEVVDGTRPPLAGDHGVMDWDTDWSRWTPGVVTPAAPGPTTVAAAGPPASAPTTTVPPTTATTKPTGH